MQNRLIEDSPLFSPWRDPVSGVVSHILTRRVAPLQQSFYFTHSGFSGNGRYLWMYLSFPPGGDAYFGRQLGVLDLEEQTLTHFPETLFSDASPYVDPVTAQVYWISGLKIWRRGPAADDAPVEVARFPEELARGRRPLRIATHLSLSADGRSFAIDASIQGDCYIGDVPIDGSGEFRLWQHFDHCYNHALFSPTDPDLMMLAQDGWTRGESSAGHTPDRIWLIRRGGSAYQALPEDPKSSSFRGHEWWDPDGKHIWFIDYRNGTEKLDLETGERSLVWSSGHTHSHASADGQLVVGDIDPHPGHWRVAFWNVRTQKEVSIVDALPDTLLPRGSYHIHPHPRFCLDDRYIVYTTNVLGTVDLAIVPVADLVAATE